MATKLWGLEQNCPFGLVNCPLHVIVICKYGESDYTLFVVDRQTAIALLRANVSVLCSERGKMKIKEINDIIIYPRELQSC